MGYNFKIEYKQGKSNKAADALSRVKYRLQSLVASAARPAWISEVLASYSQDQKFKDMISQLVTTPADVPNYALQQGILRYKHKIVIGNDKMLRTKLVLALHNSELGGHSGHRATYQRVKLLFHWPGLKQFIVDFIKQCPTC